MNTKAILLGAIIMLALMTMPFAVAQEEIQADLEGDPGITPDSGFYGLKLGWEKFKLAFTFNQEKKAAKEIELARKRLLEAKAMAAKGDVDAMKKAQEAHDGLLERARERAGKIDSEEKEQGIRSSLTKLVGLQRAIEVHEQRIEMLKDFIAENNLTDEQLEKTNELLAKMENKTAKLMEVQEKKKDNFRTKLKAVTNKSDDEIDGIVDEIESGEGLNAARKLVAEKRIAQTERAIEKLKEKLDEAKEKNKNISTSALEEQIALAESTLAEAKALYDSGDYTGTLETLKPVSNLGRNLSKIIHRLKEERKEKLEELKERFKEERETLKERAREKEEALKERAREKEEALKERAREMKENLSETEPEETPSEEAEEELETNTSS